MENSGNYLVSIQVRACSVEDVHEYPLQKKFATNKLDSKDHTIVVRDISGVVQAVGSSVNRLKIGDEVVAVLPLNHNFQISSQLCHVEECFVVEKPASLSWEISACCLSDGLKAYNALHYLAKLRPGDTLLVCNAASSFGIACLQLAASWKVKIYASVSDEDEAQLLRTMSLQVDRISSGHQYLRNLIQDETGGLGVDVVLDCGVIANMSNTSGHDWRKPMKHDVISCLAVSGRWVTSQSDLQLDPPDSEILHLKNASICHSFHDCLLLSTYQQHRVMHILQDVLRKADTSQLRPHLMSVLPASDLNSSLFPTNHRIVLKL